MAFANSSLFSSDYAAQFKPFESPDKTRKRFGPDTKDEASRTRYAMNVAAVLNNLGFDGVGEYPTAKKSKKSTATRLFLQAIRQAIRPNKILSIAVPGKRTDMIAFTKEQGLKLWPFVDMVNVMPTSVMGSLDTIKAYEEVGLDPTKINLGFAYYAKWFMTDPSSNCGEHRVSL
ncbi:hypothetical protein KXW10_006196, partial [Aspergillus fumigatus]